MNLDSVYEFAEENEIEIDEWKTRAISCMSFPEGWIACNSKLFKTTDEVKTALAHEIGHIKTGSFYNIQTPLLTRAKCEYKADKYAAAMLIPKSELLAALKRGYTEIWQLAELFGVTERLVRVACWIYLDKESA